MKSKNHEEFDINEGCDACFNNMLSKYFLRPHETAEAQLAKIVDSGKKFDYRDTLFYKIRCNKIRYDDESFSRFPKQTTWWNMPWLNESWNQKPKIANSHRKMLQILDYFKFLLTSIKERGFLMKEYSQRIRCDQLTYNGKTCYIYIDANKRMGILGYLIKKGTIKVNTIPVKLARKTEWPINCSWMDYDLAEYLYSHPFKVLKDK
ncbi:MAG: hypothetical protein AABY22_21465 [Nanoarchaeota archaeon]